MSLLLGLGLDPEDFDWKDLALCINADTEDFFSNYESSANVRATTDAMCKVCPIRRDCLIEGMESKEYGVWGGFYLNGSGNLDKMHSKHKTPQDWIDLKELLSDG